MVVKSKPGGLYISILLILLIITTYGVVSKWWAFAAVSGSVFLLILTFIKTYYRIHNGFLYIMCGMLYNKKVDLKELSKVEKVNSYGLAPALSNDRIRLFFINGNTIDLSMNEELEGTFIDELKKASQG
ncbi:PH domain-containing protein [Marinigracilibium pacificum]|uniref:Uncharacterized protein YyaB-like PH domain-containing protein n=1 Tax=Marinigracilibium pacificum TaxID=2729599 RepID=A0A848J731_9BACT|nr:PH domain-containing protein [Marinigracilibium pacificum]NMM50244.1 hypothetical protein [Marinigracilibium pacificum]